MYQYKCVQILQLLPGCICSFTCIFVSGSVWAFPGVWQRYLQYCFPSIPADPLQTPHWRPETLSWAVTLAQSEIGDIHTPGKDLWFRGICFEARSTSFSPETYSINKILHQGFRKLKTKASASSFCANC